MPFLGIVCYMEDIDALKLNLAESIAALNVRLRRQEVAVRLLWMVVADALKPSNPEYALRLLLRFEEEVVANQESLENSHALLEKIAALREIA